MGEQLDFPTPNFFLDLCHVSIQKKKYDKLDCFRFDRAPVFTVELNILPDI